MYILEGSHLKCVFASMIAFSHFSWNVVPWYSTVSNKIVSVSDISAVSFIVGWCVSLLVPWIWRNLWCLVYFCPTRKKCHLCRDVGLKTVLLKLCVSMYAILKILERKLLCVLTAASWFLLLVLSIKLERIFFEDKSKHFSDQNKKRSVFSPLSFQ